MSGIIRKPREKIERIVPTIELALLDDVAKRLREMRDLLRAPLSVGSIGIAWQNIAKDSKGNAWVFEDGKAVLREVYAIEALSTFDSVRVVELVTPPKVQLQKIGVTINASTVTLGVDIKAQTLGPLNIAINAENVIGNLPIDIKAQTVGNIGIDIKAQTLGQLNVNLAASAVTLNVNLQSQTVDINIKTSGGANIVIDKLVQTAYIERRSTLSNDNGVTAPTNPPSSLTGTTYKGKYFARGCLGMITNLSIYCKRTGSGTLTLGYTIAPTMGEIGSIVITPDSAWDWKTGALNKLWMYDSLFVYVKTCSADVSYGYDTTGDPDGRTSADSGATWSAEARRYFMRAAMEAESVGVLPIGGIVNAIEIPAVGSHASVAATNIPSLNEVTLLTISGAGTLHRLFAATYHDEMTMNIYCDGVLADTFRAAELDLGGFTASTPGIQLLSFVDGGACYMQYVIPLGFVRELKITCLNQDGADHNALARVAVTLIK